MSSIVKRSRDASPATTSRTTFRYSGDAGMLIEIVSIIFVEVKALRGRRFARGAGGGCLLCGRPALAFLRLFYGGLQRLHEVDDLGRLFLRLGCNGDLGPLDLGLNQLFELGSVLVGELGGIE